MSFENHSTINALLEYEKFNFVGDYGRNDFQFSRVCNDPILESFFSKDHSKLSVLEEICIDGKAETFIDNSFTKFGIQVEKKDARIDFV